MEELGEITLPSNYEYEWGDYCLKIKGLRTEEDVKVWIEELSKTSFVTWRVKRTFPDTKEKGILYRYKKKYRCHHNTFRGMTDKEGKTKNPKLPRKHTGCPATLTVKICREEDKNGITWCHALFDKKHNHPIKDPAFLRHRPISNETKEEIIKLFQEGHSPSSAYTIYTSRKMDELGKEDGLVSADRNNFPSKKDVMNLWAKYNKEHGQNMLQALENYTLGVNEEDYIVCVITPNKEIERQIKGTSDSINDEAVKESINDDDAFRDSVNDEVVEGSISDSINDEAVKESINDDDDAFKDFVNDEVVEVSISDINANSYIDNDSYIDILDNDTKNSDKKTPLGVPQVISSLDMMFQKLKEVIMDDPKNMVPPAMKLIENFNSCSANSKNLASAMQTAFSGVSVHHSFSKNLTHEKTNPVQQSTVAQRTLTSSKKRKLNSGQSGSSTSTKNLKGFKNGPSKTTQPLILRVDGNISVVNANIKEIIP